MTAKDFISVALCLADEEAAIEMYYQAHGDDARRDNMLTALDHMIARFCREFSAKYPRFNRSKFEHASRPIKAAEAKQRILDILKVTEGDDSRRSEIVEED